MATSDIQLRPLSYRLCKGRGLPVLVTDLIADLLEPTDALVLGKVSRTLNEQVNRHLYHKVVLDLSEAERAGRTAALFLRTLLSNANLADQVQSLAVIGFPLAKWRRDMLQAERARKFRLSRLSAPTLTFELPFLNTPEICRYSELQDTLPSAIQSSSQEMPLQAIALGILALATKIQDLKISSDLFRYPEFRTHLRTLVQTGALQDLRKADLCTDLVMDTWSWKLPHILALADWDYSLLSPFLVNTIETINVSMALRPREMSQLRFSTVTRLVLRHVQESREYDVSALLAATCNLRYLEYHVYVSWFWFSTTSYKTNRRATHDPDHRDYIGHDALFDALHHVAGTLEELIATQYLDDEEPYLDYGMGADYPPPYRLDGQLLCMKRLHAITVPYVSLLGWNRRQIAWDKILPTCVRSVTLNDDLRENLPYSDDLRPNFPEWTDEALTPVFLDLIDWLAGHGHAATTSFGLVLNQDEEFHPDFGGPLEDALSKRCAEKGVSWLSIRRFFDDAHLTEIRSVAKRSDQ